MDPANNFVLDGSVTLVWGFTDEDDDYATTILDRMPDLQAHVPNLWPLEVANALLVGERRGRTTPADAARFLSILGAFPIAIDDETVARPWVEITHLALRLQPFYLRRILPRIGHASRSAACHARRQAEDSRKSRWSIAFRH